MNFSRFVAEHRPVVILVLIVSLSLASLATGTEPTFIQRGIKRLVSLTSYPFLRTRYVVEKGMDYTFGVAFDYSALREANELLRQDVLTLKQEILRREELREENQRLRETLRFIRSEPRYSFEPVRVLESMKGMLTIDRGASHGVKESMCVVTEEGVVGIVTEVLDFTSNVATIHHPDCRVGAMVQRGRLRAYDGMIHAGGSDLSRICTMYYIDRAISGDAVQPGDIVVTSPESLFPSGYPVGRIRATSDILGATSEAMSSSLWKQADVVPFVDPYRLDEVLLVWQSVPPAEELAGPVLAREVASASPTLPDERSMQERYAP